MPGAGLPERHRTLRAAIDWSYDLLGAEEQALFTSLGVFVGGFTLDGAKAVAGDLELDVVAGVESLLNNSLLRTEPMAAGEPRFGMLETIREYALERLAERGDERGRAPPPRRLLSPARGGGRAGATRAAAAASGSSGSTPSATTSVPR